MSRWTNLLAQGRDVTLAAVGYVVPLGPDRLEPMPLPHPTPPPAPPARTGIRHVARWAGSARAAAQLDAGGRGTVARKMANLYAPTAYRELRSDVIARRRAVAGRTPAKPIRQRVWLFGGRADEEPAAMGKSLAESIGSCTSC